MNTKKLLQVVGAIIIVAFLGYAVYELSHLSSGRGGTSNADSISLDSNLTVGLLSSLNGTTTIGTPAMPAVFSIGGTYTMSTTAPTVLYTNSGFGTLSCNSGNGQVYATTTATAFFAPSVNISLGTSTTKTGFPSNLLASTTIATTTPTVTTLISSRFLLKSGESLVGGLGDYMTTGASSTNYGRWSIKANGIFCSLLN